MEVKTISTPTAETSVKHVGLLRTMRRDVHSAIERDPAARTRLEIVLGYPGLPALWGHGQDAGATNIDKGS